MVEVQSQPSDLAALTSRGFTGYPRLRTTCATKASDRAPPVSPVTTMVRHVARGLLETFFFVELHL